MPSPRPRRWSPADVPDDPAATLPDEGPVTVVDTVAPTATDRDERDLDRRARFRATLRTRPTPLRPTPPPSRLQPATATPDAFSDGWFSDSSAIVPAILWGLLLAAIGYGIYWLSHKVRRYWVGVLAGFVPFIVVLYFFYENVNRLLPPNL